MFKFLAYKFGQFLVNHLPLKACYRFAMLISDLQYYCSFRDRRAVKNNIKVILQSNDDHPELVKAVFRNFGKYLVDFFRMAREIDQKFIQDRVQIENLQYIDQALAKGRGVIILTAHLGNWELGGVILSMLGYPFVAVALPHKERPVNDLFNKQRETRGIEIVPPNLAIRKCLETLKKNGIVALAADRDFGVNGIVLDFLGRKALLPKGAALFSLKTGALIVPIFLVRDQEDHFKLIIEKPIEPPAEFAGKSTDFFHQEVLAKTMRAGVAVIEKRIRQYPDQWLMFRKFWIEEAK